MGRARRWILGLLAAAGLLAALAALALRDLPDPAPLRDPAWVAQRFQLKEWTRVEAVAPLALRAILISEDDTFFSHEGLRLDELGSAAWDDLLSLRYKRGASSITQQVVRNALLSKDKSLRRKLRELWLARRADAAVGKRRLLEDYLNLAEWGSRGERGIAAASRERFGKEPAALSPAEGALLSWLLPNPRLRGRALRHGLPGPALRHVRLILRRLQQEGSLDDEVAERLIKQPFAVPAEAVTAPMPGAAPAPAPLNGGAR